MEDSKQQLSYDESSIQSFEGIEAMRKRPTMYIHSLGSYGVFKMFLEIFTNSVDEFIVGRCSQISVSVNLKENSFLIIDNGAGIPIGKLREILEKPHSGGKFGSGAYKFQAGMNGIGTTVTNALSKTFRVTVMRDNKKAVIEYKRGKESFYEDIHWGGEKSGTSVYFIPDPTIFTDFTLDKDEYLNYIETTAHINTGLEIKVNWDGGRREFIFKSEGGIPEYLGILSKREKIRPITQPISILSSSSDDRMRINAALSFSTDLSKELIVGYVNGLITKNGGTHITGVRAGVSMAVNKFISDNGIIPKNAKYSVKSSDVQEAMIAVIAASHIDPLFNGQTKEEFTSTEYTNFAKSATYQCVNEYFSDNPEDAMKIAKLVRKIAEARHAASAAKEEKLKPSNIGKSTFGKITADLRDCQIHDRDKSELFIVEGKSAAGSCNSARNSNYQALYLLQGKIKNVIKSKKNDDLKQLIDVLGCGSGANFNINKLRYNKIFIATDADTDGAHIRSLLIAFFYKETPELITEGKIYLVNPPLFSIKSKNKHIFLLNEDHYKMARSNVAVNTMDLLAHNGRILSEDVFRLYIRKIIPAYESLSQYTRWLNIEGDILEMIVLHLKDIIKGDYSSIKEIGWDARCISNKNKCIILEFDRGVEHKFFEINEEFINGPYTDIFNILKDVYLSRVFLRVRKTGNIFGGTTYRNGNIIANIFDTSIRGGINRYKGLGEMPPTLLKETAFDIETRRVVRVTMDDVNLAYEAMETFLSSNLEKKKEVFSYENMRD